MVRDDTYANRLTEDFAAKGFNGTRDLGLVPSRGTTSPESCRVPWGLLHLLKPCVVLVDV